MTPKTITKQEAESKVAELVAWLAYADDVTHLRKLKEVQRNYWIGKLVFMDEHNMDKIVVNG